MLGRFLAKPLPKAFWTSFDSKEIAFMLNEYVLYEKYLSVLQEVGETKLTKAHSKIISEGLKELELRNISIDLFIPLMFCNIDWDEVEIEVNRLNNRQNNTLFVTRKLSSPVEEVFDLSKPWVKDKVDKLKCFKKGARFNNEISHHQQERQAIHFQKTWVMSIAVPLSI